jgi:crotonobetainyl-CoA:carnitine CoA-transferase CaiB-like acyl-CoA transferase
VGDALLDYFANHRDQTRQGNRHVAYAPSGCYRCAEANRWISIVITSDEEWRAFAGFAGGSKLEDDLRFADGFLRWKNRLDLDEIISAWTADKNDKDIACELQAIGVAAMPVMYPDDIFADEHLAARKWWKIIEREEGGPYIMAGGLPWSVRDMPSPATYEAGSNPGSDSDYVLRELLHFSEAEAGLLRKENVVG